MRQFPSPFCFVSSFSVYNSKSVCTSALNIWCSLIGFQTCHHLLHHKVSHAEGWEKLLFTSLYYTIWKVPYSLLHSSFEMVLFFPTPTDFCRLREESISHFIKIEWSHVSSLSVCWFIKGIMAMLAKRKKKIHRENIFIKLPKVIRDQCNFFNFKNSLSNQKKKNGDNPWIPSEAAYDVS